MVDRVEVQRSAVVAFRLARRQLSDARAALPLGMARRQRSLDGARTLEEDRRSLMAAGGPRGTT